MPSFDQCPFDVVNAILAHHCDLRALKQCALVCKAWLGLCRPLIWADLLIYPCAHEGCQWEWERPQNFISFRAFSVLVYRRGDIARLIRRIEYCGDSPCRFSWAPRPPPLVFHAVRYLSNLTSFSLRPSDWSDYSLESLDPPNSQSTTESLRLQNFDFQCSQPQILKDLTAKRNNGTPAFDFSSLETACLAVYDKQRFDVLRTCCEPSHRLVELVLTSYVASFHGLQGFLSSVQHTLKSLTLIDSPEAALDYKFLGGLAGELEQLRGSNHLQTIHIVVNLSRHAGSVGGHGRFEIGDGDTLLDQTLTRSGWPELKEVEIYVEIYAKVDTSDFPLLTEEFLTQPILWRSALGGVHFPQLERCDQVKFKYLATYDFPKYCTISINSG